MRICLAKKNKNHFFHIRSGSVDRLPVTSRIKKKTLAEPVFHDKGGTSPNSVRVDRSLRFNTPANETVLKSGDPT